MGGRVYIRDYKDLIHLRDVMDYCGDSFLKVLDEVDAYLRSCMQAFERQRDMLKMQLDRAQEEMNMAKQALSSCESSQRWDEEDKCYRPSCRSEKSHVESACRHRDECERKYNEACRIVSDCSYQIDQYKKWGGLLSPPGGEKTLEYLAKGHTTEGVGKMNAILDIVVKRYLGRQIEATSETEAPTGEKAQQFKEASGRVKEKQKAESSSNKIAGADVSMICPGCKRPIPICICARNRER